MKVVGLLSGGKDSCFNLLHCVKNGHEIVALATLAPPEGIDEIDSYMYQTVGHDAVHLVAEAMDLPLYRHVITGTAVNQGSEYGSRLPTQPQKSLERSKGKTKDETEDLYELLLQVKSHHPDIEAVSVGAILSNYQRVRVEHVALLPEINLVPLAFLWQRNQRELMDEMIESGLEAIIIKTAGAGLGERDLGKSLAQMRSKLHALNEKYDSHICGEGGEYETLTLDSPLFKRRIKLDEIETVIHSEATFASVSYLRIKAAHLEDKGSACAGPLVCPPELDELSQETLRALRELQSTSSDTSRTAASHPSSEVAPSTSSSATPSLARKGEWFSLSNITPTADTSLDAEIKSLFTSLSSTLSSHNLSPQDIQHVNLYLRSMTDFAQVNAVYKTHFGSSPPSRACIAIGPALGTAAMMEVVGWQSSEENRKGGMETRKALHVQGRSYWAPANIGPYSQAVSVGQRITIAGQIGLRSADLSLPDDVELQIVLSLQHVRRVLYSVLEQRAHKCKHWVEGGICWVEQQATEHATRFLSQKASTAWLSRASEAEDDDEDGTNQLETDDERSWHRHWKGDIDTTSNLPLVFAVLPHGSLPRGAKVEWQVTARTGLLSVDEQYDEVDDPEAGPPLQTAEYGFTSISDAKGESAPSIYCLMRPDSAGWGEKEQKLCQRAVTDAVSVRVLVAATVPTAVIHECLRLIKRVTEHAIVTVLPVVSLSSPKSESSEQLEEWEIALVCWG